jgi:hypothetical protein
LDVILNIIKLSVVLYIITLTIITVYVYNNPSGYFDHSVPGKIYHILLDGKGKYKIRFKLKRSGQRYTIIENGTYSDPGYNEITLTTQNGRTYKIRVWGRGTKLPEYRIMP